MMTFKTETLHYVVSYHFCHCVWPVLLCKAKVELKKIWKNDVNHIEMHDKKKESESKTMGQSLKSTH